MFLLSSWLEINDTVAEKPVVFRVTLTSRMTEFVMISLQVCGTLESALRGEVQLFITIPMSGGEFSVFFSLQSVKSTNFPCVKYC